jgi:PKD repeat protein
VGGVSGFDVIDDAPLESGGAFTKPPPPPPTLNAGLPTTFTLGVFMDSFANAPAKDFTANVDWGDNTSETVSSIVPQSNIVLFGGAGFAVQGTHAYDHAGVYPVKVTVSDVGGSTVTLPDASVTVLPPPVITSLSPASEAENGGQYIIAVTGDNFTTSNTVQWNGVPVLTKVVSTTEEDAHIDANLVAEAGTATVSIGNASVPFVIRDAPLSVGVSPPRATAGVPTGTVFVGSLIDGQPSSNIADLGATIDWGDNSQSAGVLVPDPLRHNTFAITGSHTYAAPGPYTLSIKATDVGGATNTGSYPFTVRGPTPGTTPPPAGVNPTAPLSPPAATGSPAANRPRGWGLLQGRSAQLGTLFVVLAYPPARAGLAGAFQQTTGLSPQGDAALLGRLQSPGVQDALFLLLASPQARGNLSGAFRQATGFSPGAAAAALLPGLLPPVPNSPRL